MGSAVPVAGVDSDRRDSMRCMPTMRMFVAVVPPAEVLDDLARFLEPRRDADGPLRWAPPEQWHITLAFMSSVRERSLDGLVQRLGRAAARRSPVALRLVGGGAFPTVESARVLWVGTPIDVVGDLTRLAEGARSAANKAGANVARARFRPHVTVARLRIPGDVTGWLRVLEPYAGPPWTAHEISLVQSHLGEGVGGRPRHETVASLPVG